MRSLNLWRALVLLTFVASVAFIVIVATTRTRGTMYTLITNISSIDLLQTATSRGWNPPLDLPTLNRTHLDLLVGIPCSYRAGGIGANYLSRTLSELFLGIDRTPDVSVAVLLLLTDAPRSNERKALLQILQIQYSARIAAKQLLIVLPPSSIYQRLDSPCTLQQTFDDGLLRIMWRTKLALDAAYLLHVASHLPTSYYLHLEDDIGARSARTWVARVSAFMNVSWEATVLSFADGHCGKGEHFSRQKTIGGMFAFLMRRETLQGAAEYFKENAEEAPVDWLMARYLTSISPHERGIQCEEKLFAHFGRTSTRSHLTQRGLSEQNRVPMDDLRYRDDAIAETLRYDHWFDCEHLRVWPTPQFMQTSKFSFVISSSPTFFLSPNISSTRRVHANLVRLLGSNATSCPRGEISSIYISIVLNPTPDSYELSITSSSIRLTASSDSALLLGWFTLKQVLRYSVYSDCWRTSGSPLTIRDFPRLPYRGLLVDTTDGYTLATPVLIKIIHVIAAAKMNVLHWRIQDEASLSKNGSLSPFGEYSSQEVESIFAAANDQGVQIIPQIPLPTLGVSSTTPSSWTVTINDNDTLENLFSSPESMRRFEDFLVTLLHYLPHRIIHFGRNSISSSCFDNAELHNWTVQHETHVETIRDQFMKAFSSLLDRLQVVAHFDDYARVQFPAAAAVRVNSANTTASLTSPHVIAAHGWNLLYECINYEECFKANLLASQDVWGAEATADRMLAASYDQHFFSILTVAHRMWAAPNEPFLLPSMHYLCKHLVLDGWIDYHTCNSYSPAERQPDIPFRSKIDLKSCAWFPATPVETHRRTYLPRTTITAKKNLAGGQVAEKLERNRELQAMRRGEKRPGFTRRP